MQVIINMEVTVVNATSGDSSDMAEGFKSCYIQVICVKTILSSALLAIAYCISHLFHKSPHKKSIPGFLFSSNRVFALYTITKRKANGR